MGVTRREFLTAGGLGVLGVIILPGKLVKALEGVLPANARDIARLTGSEGKSSPWRFIVDTRKCIGCGRCIQACKNENDVPDSHYRTWVERYVITNDEEVLVDSPGGGISGFELGKTDARYEGVDILKSFFVPKLCNQCQKPPCTQVCPVGATYKTPDGVVLVDRKGCIGCRYCIQACPYGARYFHPGLKVVDKCTWCYHRITRDMPPACVEVCPVGARIFGNVKEERISKLLREESMSVLKPDLGTEPAVYYIGLEKGVH